MNTYRIMAMAAALVVGAIALGGAASASGGDEQPAQHAAQVPEAEPPQAEPPTVGTGSAATICAAITEAGYRPYDYIRRAGGKWTHDPDWAGAEGARMSSLWGSTPECRAEGSGDTGPAISVSKNTYRAPSWSQPAGRSEPVYRNPQPRIDQSPTPTRRRSSMRCR